MENEKRLIDANALLRHKRKMSGADFGGEFWDEAVLASDIKNAPTVDAVEVVRCRDCIHYDFGVCLKIYSDGAVNQCAWQARNEDDFCSYGERKDVLGNGKA